MKDRRPPRIICLTRNRGGGRQRPQVRAALTHNSAPPRSEVAGSQDAAKPGRWEPKKLEASKMLRGEVWRVFHHLGDSVKSFAPDESLQQ